MAERTETLDLSWDDIFHYASLLASKIPKEQFNTLLAPVRGGLIPAGILCHHWPREIVVRTIKARTYDTEGKHKTLLSFMPNLIGRKVLLVDDILDSGSTTDAICNYFSDKDVYLHVATLFVREGKEKATHWYGKVVPKGVWLNFPWELERGPAEAAIPF